MRHQIAVILWDLRKKHGSGYVRRLQHLVDGAIVRPPWHETIQYTLKGEALLLYNTPGHSTLAVRIS